MLLGFLFGVIILLMLLPWIDKTVDSAPIELNIALVFSILMIPIGLFMDNYRKYEPAELKVLPTELVIISSSFNTSLKYSQINNLRATNSTFGKINYIISTIDDQKIEIRSKQELYDGLIENLPKV